MFRHENNFGLETGDQMGGGSFDAKARGKKTRASVPLIINMTN